jgi:hypothetical protein
MLASVAQARRAQAPLLRYGRAAVGANACQRAAPVAKKRGELVHPHGVEMIATLTGWGASFAPISGAPPQIAALVHPGMVLLDLLGPHTVFNLLRADVHLVAKDRAPVSTDVGYLITPTMTLGECPMVLDVLFVPDGLEGTVALMDDADVLNFLATRGARARYKRVLDIRAPAIAAAKEAAIRAGARLTPPQAVT